jgi:6,7-dimethyl-8-ribityllumazine synthase
MLTKTKRAKRTGDAGGRYVIVASRYNAKYVDAMVRAARRELAGGGAATVDVYRVPGAFEVPVVVARVARGWPRPVAVICLGVVIRGETAHAEHIGVGVTQALIRLQIDTGVPMIHEVLLLENQEQARVRCLDREHNRGTEAAATALAMGALMRRLPPDLDDVPF